MDYKKIYTQDYFSGKNSFFYKFGYGKFSNTHFNYLFKKIKPYLKKEGKILDIGCAYGLVLKKFPPSWEKYGIDISQHAISQAQKNLPEGLFKIGNVATNIDFQDNFFDLIIINDVLEHLEQPAQVLSNVFKCLKKDSLLYVTTPNLNLIRKIIYKKADLAEHHISLMSYQQLKLILKKTGFKIIASHTFTNLLGQVYLEFKSNLGLESLFICKK